MNVTNTFCSFAMINAVLNKQSRYGPEGGKKSGGQAMKMKYCDQCGAQIPLMAGFCTRCGAEQADNTLTEKKKHKTGGAIACILLLIVIAGGAFLFIQHFEMPGAKTPYEKLSDEGKAVVNALYDNSGFWQENINTYSFRDGYFITKTFRDGNPAADIYMCDEKKYSLDGGTLLETKTNPYSIYTLSDEQKRNFLAKHWNPNWTAEEKINDLAENYYNAFEKK